MSTDYKYRTRPSHDTTSTRYTRLGRETGSAGRYRSPSTGRTSDISSHVGMGSFGTGRSSRPLPACPGPYDINGRRISTYEAISTLPRNTKGTSGIGSSTYSSSYSRPSLGSQRSTSLSRDHYIPAGRKSSVSELRNKFETTSISDTSSSSLKRGKKSTSLYDVNKNVYSPEKHDKHEKYEREIVDSLLHDKSSNTSTRIKKTYSSSYSPRHYETDQKLPDINKTLRSRSNSREKVKEESLPDKHSHRKDSNTSSLVGGYTHSTSSHCSNTSINDTSSCILKRGKTSISLYGVNKNVFTAEKYEKYERETVDRLLHSLLQDKSNNATAASKSTVGSPLENTATGGRLTDSEPEIYSCPVCLEYLLKLNPRFLSCHHYFCQQCLQMLNESGQVCCPTCRKITSVPDKDIAKLDINFPLVQVMEREKQIKTEKQQDVKAQLQKKGTTMAAGRCCNFCDDEKAGFRCTDCNKFLCDGCKQKHIKMKMFKSHNIVILRLCPKHMDAISYVCLQCLQALCVKCIVVDHAKHEDKVKEYTEGVETLKSDLNMMQNNLKKDKNLVERYKEESNSTKSDILKEKEKLQRKRENFMKKLEEIDGILRDLSDKEIKCDKEVKIYTELHEKFNSTSKNVEKLVQSEEHQILVGFPDQRISVEKLLSETENLKKLTGIKFKGRLIDRITYRINTIL